MLKQSFIYQIFRKKDESLPQLMQFAKSVGFAATEFWSRDEHSLGVIEAAHAAGLEVASMGGHDGIKRGLNDPAQHARIEAELRDAIDFAAKHRVRSLIVFSGDRNPQRSREEAIANTVAGLKRVAGLAEKAGVLLNIELLNSKVDHAGYDFDQTSWGVEVCRRVASPNVKILYDIYHAQIMEGDVIRTIRDNIQYIGHFHTAGNPGRHDLDETQELNYKAIADAIRAAKFEHFIGHEFWTRKDPHTGLADAFKACS